MFLIVNENLFSLQFMFIFEILDLNLFKRFRILNFKTPKEIITLKEIIFSGNILIRNIYV